jgi:hypothetical protein
MGRGQHGADKGHCCKAAEHSARQTRGGRARVPDGGAGWLLSPRAWTASGCALDVQLFRAGVPLLSVVARLRSRGRGVSSASLNFTDSSTRPASTARETSCMTHAVEHKFALRAPWDWSGKVGFGPAGVRHKNRPGSSGRDLKDSHEQSGFVAEPVLVRTGISFALPVES